VTSTTRLRLSKQQTATNDRVWGSVLNAGFMALLDDALAGALSLDLTAGNVVLTALDGETDQARNMTLLLTGAPAGVRTVTVPAVQKVYTVHNACGQNVTVKTQTGAVGVVIANGVRATVFADEASDSVIQPLLHTDQNVIALTSNLTPVPCTVPGATGGTSNPTYYYGVEGGQLIVGSPGYSVTITAPSFFVNPTGGFTWPVSADLDTRTLYFLEAAAVREGYMTIAPGSIVYGRADTVALTSVSITLPEHWFILKSA
jgi:hypothetical protein